MDSAINPPKLQYNRFVFFFLTAYYSLSTIMPAVPQYISSYLYMGTVVLLFVLIIMRNNENFQFYLNFMLPLLFLVILQVLNLYINKIGNLPLFIYSEILYLIPVILMYYLLVTNDRKVISALIIVVFVAFVFTAFTTYFGLINNPNAARILATIEDSKDPKAVFWGRMNIGGFETIYSIVLLMPILICILKQKKLNILIFAGITIIFFLSIFESQYAMALFLFLSSIVLLFVKRNFKAKHVFVIIMILVCTYFVFKPLLAQLLMNLASSVNSRTLSDRFAFIANSMLGIDTDTDVKKRFDLYMDSINTFLKYPILGSWVTKRYGGGGHSFILDTLAQFGLVGGTALFVFFKQIYVKLYLPFKNTEYFGFLVWSFLLFIFLSIFNPTGFLIVLCFIVPGVAYIIQDKEYRINAKGVPSLESNVGM